MVCEPNIRIKSMLITHCDCLPGMEFQEERKIIWELYNLFNTTVGPWTSSVILSLAGFLWSCDPKSGVSWLLDHGQKKHGNETLGGWCRGEHMACQSRYIPSHHDSMGASLLNGRCIKDVSLFQPFELVVVPMANTPHSEQHWDREQGGGRDNVGDRDQRQPVREFICT